MMDTLWIVIPLIVIAVIAFAWLGNNEKLNPKALFRAIIDESLDLIAAFVFGVFGFSWEQFKEKNLAENTPVKN